MNYPIWQVGFPGGLLIATVAVLHVFVSHFAVGGGAYLVLTEHSAYRRKDADLLTYVKHHSKVFALITVVFGAVTGVGIWFTIGLVSPEGTSSLIHTFVWGWAIEWVFFFVEIAAALIYAYNWENLDRRTHLTIGWIYFIAAWASLAVINGIITYMLTPGQWLQTKNFWDGILNPTYLPSLLIRSAMAAALAGMFGMVTALHESSPVREHIVRWAGAWLTIGIALLVPFGLWYYSRFPGFAHTYVAGLIPAARNAVFAGTVCAALVLLLGFLFALWNPHMMNVAVVTVLLLAGLTVMAAGEYLREVGRKPYVINGYIYANDIRVADVQRIDHEGVAAVSRWVGRATDPVAYGHQLFATQCAACHSIDGYRAIRPLVRGWDEKFAAEMLLHLPLIRGTMPPFAGNEQDRRALGTFLASLGPATIVGSDDVKAGRYVFETRCAVCHTLGGDRRPLSFAGMDKKSIEELTRMLGDISSDMPPFTGTEAERRALAAYLHSAAK